MSIWRWLCWAIALSCLVVAEWKYERLMTIDDVVKNVTVHGQLSTRSMENLGRASSVPSSSRPVFHIVMPFTLSFVRTLPLINDVMHGWTKYAEERPNYRFHAVNSEMIVRKYGQSIRRSVEKRHSFVYVSAKPLIALYMFRKLSFKVFEQSSSQSAWMVLIDADVVNGTSALTTILDAAKQVYRLSSAEQCAVIAQTAPTTVNSGILFFPFTTSAHNLLMDWAAVAERESKENRDWQGDQGMLQLLLLRHLARQSNQTKSSSLSPHSASDLTRRLQSRKAKPKPGPRKRSQHAMQRAEQTRQDIAKKRAEREQRAHDSSSASVSTVRPARRPKRKPNPKQSAHSPSTETTSVASSWWSFLWTERNQSSLKSDSSESSQSIHDSNAFQPSLDTLPYGDCSQLPLGNVGRGHCMGRTLLHYGVFSQSPSPALLPFCLLIYPVFNAHDWHYHQDYVEEGEYRMVLRAESNSSVCNTISPSHYHGKNTTILRSLLSPNTKSGTACGSHRCGNHSSDQCMKYTAEYLRGIVEQFPAISGVK